MNLLEFQNLCERFSLCLNRPCANLTCLSSGHLDAQSRSNVERSGTLHLLRFWNHLRKGAAWGDGVGSCDHIWSSQLSLARRSGSGISIELVIRQDYVQFGGAG